MELSKRLPEMSEDEQFELLASDGMIVKRPLLITDKKVLAGFKETDQNVIQQGWNKCAIVQGRLLDSIFCRIENEEEPNNLLFM